MKKEGIVIRLDGQYLDILMLEDVCCNSFEKKYVKDEKQLHNCTNCSGCSGFTATQFKTIRVLNKNKKDIKVGDKISYSLNFLALQFFIIIFLPFLAFGLSFALLRFYSYSEELSVLLSFLISFFIIGLNFFLTKKIFIPFV